MKYQFGIMILLFSVCSYGQSKFHVYIEASASAVVNRNKWIVDISTDNEKIKVSYKFKDSVSTKIQNDLNFKMYDSLLSQSMIPDSLTDFYLDKLHSIYELYTFYTVDSVILPICETKKLIDLLKEIFSTPIDTLENTVANKNRFVLDGVFMQIYLINNITNKIVYAHSPSEESHPILYQFITTIMALGRNNKVNSIVTKQRTYGY